MDIQTLITKKAKLWEEAKNFLDTHTGEDGMMSAEDAAIYDKMEADMVEIGKSIERFEKNTRVENSLSQPMSQPILGKPQDISHEIKEGRASNEYHKAMISAIRAKFQTVSNVLQEGVDADGGYLVPQEWDPRLIEGLKQDNIMRLLGTTITTAGKHKINVAATTPAAAWIEEGGQLTFGNATFDQKILDAHKLHVAIKVTEELLYDTAFNIEGYIIQEFISAIANAEEDAFLNGTEEGNNPTGLFVTATTDNSPETTGASISTDDVISLIYSLKRPYRRNAAFIANDQTVAAIRKLKDTNGYIWQPSYQAGEPDMILGYKLYTSAYAPTLQAGKPCLAFGDYSYYNIGDRGIRSLQILRELFAGNGMVGYVLKERVDGLLLLPEAVQVLKLKA